MDMTDEEIVRLIVRWSVVSIIAIACFCCFAGWRVSSESSRPVDPVVSVDPATPSYDLTPHSLKCLKAGWYNELYAVRTQARVRPVASPAAAFDQFIDRLIEQCGVASSEKGLALFYLGSMDEPVARHR
jgi:hypothetical protein